MFRLCGWKRGGVDHQAASDAAAAVDTADTPHVGRQSGCRELSGRPIILAQKPPGLPEWDSAQGNRPRSWWTNQLYVEPRVGRRRDARGIADLRVHLATRLRDLRDQRRG